MEEMYVKHVVIGTGAAGFQAAARLSQFGEKDVAIVAEQITAGTSRNTGSDKQTYYKLSLAGSDEDSVKNLADDLFAGQCVDGDQALCEAALSTQCFYRLVELGVPFPCNDYGEYIGYKTDHDRGRRATSVGPYTSRIMTECLEKEVKERGIRILDKFQVIRLLVTDETIRGVLCLDKNRKSLDYVIIWCENVIYATGGPAGMYRDSVYPASQLGSSGIAFLAGVKGKNLTEWQFGMASLNPRWNVSGTYMQVLPRVVSTDPDGSNEREFLMDYFESPEEMMSSLFLKGYQWPFDSNKVFGGSSVIDLLVYQESILKGRRIFLDYRKNPEDKEITFTKLSHEAYDYLSQAGACFGTPIERLKHMNQPAIAFYKEHGVDLYEEMLEIAICAQHNNGGLATNSNWETNIHGLFAVGEVCGSHGVTRPGGSALNAGQVGALRAADYIANLKGAEPGGVQAQPGTQPGAQPEQQPVAQARQQPEQQPEAQAREAARGQAMEHIQLIKEASGATSLSEAWKKASARMSRYGGMIRDEEGLKTALKENEQELDHFCQYVKVDDESQAGLFYHLYDMLLCQKVYLSAMLDYVQKGGGSRGSALYTCPDGEKPDGRMPDIYTCKLDKGAHGDVVQEICLKDGACTAQWRPVRPIPEPDYFFENQWKRYRERRAKAR